MDDQSLRVELQFLIENQSETTGTYSNYYGSGDFGVVSKAMAVENLQRQFKVLSKKHNEHGGWEFRLPNVVMLSGTDTIRETMDLSALNPLEASLLKIGFGATFDFQRLNALGAVNYSRQLRDAEYRLNKHMEKSMPIPSSLKFHFLPIEGNRKMLAVLLRDRHDAMTPFGLRGTGLKKMITLLTELVTTSGNAFHRILLLDEPENSLHPDAQHLFGNFFSISLLRGTHRLSTQHIRQAWSIRCAPNR